MSNNIALSYMNSVGKIKTLFEYQIDLSHTEDRATILIYQKETGNTFEATLTKSLNTMTKSLMNQNNNDYFDESELRDISLSELSFVMLDFWFFINQKISNRYLKICTDCAEFSEMEWVKDIIPQTKMSYIQESLSYILPRDQKSQLGYQKAWAYLFDEATSIIWRSYSDDYFCRKFLTGALNLVPKKSCLHITKMDNIVQMFNQKKR